MTRRCYEYCFVVPGHVLAKLISMIANAQMDGLRSNHCLNCSSPGLNRMRKGKPKGSLAPMHSY